MDDKLYGISSIFNSIDSHFLIRRMYGLISNLNDPITSKKLTRTPGWTVGNDIFNENCIALQDNKQIDIKTEEYVDDLKFIDLKPSFWLNFMA